MFMFLFTTKKTLPEQQINVWAAYQQRKYRYSSVVAGSYIGQYVAWQTEFIKFVGKDDVCDVEEDDIRKFLRHVRGSAEAQFEIEDAQKAIHAIIQFYAARGKRKERDKLLEV